MKSLKWLAVLIPLICLSFWHLQNKAYPHRVPASFFVITQEIALAYENHGLLNALKVSYLDRFGKFLLHPVFGVPIYLLTGKNVLQTIALTMLFFYGVFLYFIFSTFKKYLPAFQALVGTWILAFLPWAVNSTYNYNAEMPLLACAAGALYSYLNIFDRHRPRDYFLFALWAASAICMRPVEALFFFFWPAVYLVLRVKKEKRPLRPLVSGTLLCFSIVLFWYSPYIREVYNWAYRATFSAYTQANGNRTTHDGFNFFINTLSILGGLPLLSLIFMALINFKTWPGKLQKEKMNFFFLTVFSTLLAGATTHNGDFRYYYVNVLVLFMGLIIIALDSQGRWPKARFFMGGALAVFLIFNYTNSLLNPGFPKQSLMTQNGNSELLAPSPKEPTDARLFIGELHQSMPKLIEAQALMDVKFDLSLLENYGPWLLNVVAREQGLRWWFQGDCHPDECDLVITVKENEQGAKVLLVQRPRFK
jgi:hypothetical protein